MNETYKVEIAVTRTVSDGEVEGMEFLEHYQVQVANEDRASSLFATLQTTLERSI